MNQNVLIVDENVNAYMIAHTLLSIRDFRVFGARTVGDALDVIRQEDIALVILGLSSSGLREFEGLRQLRVRFHALRLAIMSDWEEPAVERLVYRLGADAFIRKPITPGRFIDTVERIATTAPNGDGSLPTSNANRCSACRGDAASAYLRR
jgi:DNA-binding response OmpR family regulator